MDEYKSKSWLVMGEYSCGLWDDRGYCTDPGDEEINAPPEYVKRFQAWVDRYDDLITVKGLDLASFNKEGRALAAELKKIVGPDIKVTYVYEKPSNGKCPWPDREEMP